jgi:taurine dioxygenase
VTDTLTNPPTYRHITVEPVTPAIGAEVEGVALSGTLAGEVVDELKDAFLRHKVLIFRAQHGMSLQDHVGFGRLFGELALHPEFVRTTSDHPEVVVLESKPNSNADYWHTDSTYLTVPPTSSILRARVVPAVGGDTLFANMELVYDNLEPELKNRITGLKTWNTIGHVANLSLRYGSKEPASLSTGQADSRISGAVEHYPSVEHPLVRTHPETAKRSVFYSPATAVRLVGLDAAESAELLRRVEHLADVPEYQCRVRWAVDTVVMWDNRCVQHYAVADYFPASRRMERVTVLGTDRPV